MGALHSPYAVAGDLVLLCETREEMGALQGKGKGEKDEEACDAEAN